EHNTVEVGAGLVRQLCVGVDQREAPGTEVLDANPGAAQGLARLDVGNHAGDRFAQWNFNAIVLAPLDASEGGRVGEGQGGRAFVGGALQIAAGKMNIDVVDLSVEDDRRCPRQTGVQVFVRGVVNDHSS